MGVYHQARLILYVFVYNCLDFWHKLIENGSKASWFLFKKLRMFYSLSTVGILLYIQVMCWMLLAGSKSCKLIGLVGTACRSTLSTEQGISYIKHEDHECRVFIAVYWEIREDRLKSSHSAEDSLSHAEKTYVTSLDLSLSSAVSPLSRHFLEIWG